MKCRSLDLEQRLRDKNSDADGVQASFDGLVKPQQSNFDGNKFLVAFFSL